MLFDFEGQLYIGEGHEGTACRLSEWVGVALVQHPWREGLVNPGGGVRLHKKRRLSLLHKREVQGRGISSRGKTGAPLLLHGKILQS